MRIEILILLVLISSLCSCQEKKQTLLTKQEREILSRSIADAPDSIVQGSPAYMKLLDSALVVDPFNGSAYQKKAVVYTKQVRPIDAFVMLDSAVKYSFAEIAYRAWVRLYWYRDYKGSLTDLNTYDQKTSTISDYAWGEHVQYLMGICNLFLKDYNASIKHFDHYIEDETKNAGADFVDYKAFLYKSINLYHLGEFNKAIETIDLGLTKAKNSSELLFWKAKNLFALQQQTEAQEFYQKSKQNFLKGNNYQDASYEVFYELYIEDIEKGIRECGR